MTLVADALANATQAVRERIGDFQPEVVVVLGSGLGGLADAVATQAVVPYDEIRDLPRSSVVGHPGQFVAGTLEGRRVLLQRGRLHLYEGYSPDTVVLPVRIAAALGATTLLVTNAAGSLRRRFVPPALMLIADQINLQFRFPLAGSVVPPENRFPDMSNPYDPALRAVARQVALEGHIRLIEGVYAGVLGPSYETPAEVAMLRRMGADAVGMSTVPEVLVARARGMRVLGISVLTNLAAGLSADPLKHEEVLAVGRMVARDLETVVSGVLRAK